MSKFVLSAQEIWYGQYRISPDLSSVAIAYEAEAKDSTVFGNDTRTMIGGLKATNFSASGYVDLANSDAGLFSGIGVAGVPITVGMTTGALGTQAYLFNAIATEYNTGETVGEIQKFNLAALSRSRLVNGFIAHNASRSATGTTAGVDLGSPAVGQRLFAALHVISASGTNPTLDISIGSDNNSGFTSELTDVLEFDQVTAAGHQFSSVLLSSTDDYFRVNYTLGGTNPVFNFVVSIGVL